MEVEKENINNNEIEPVAAGSKKAEQKPNAEQDNISKDVLKKEAFLKKQEEKLVKREVENEIRRKKALQSIQYLLGLSEKYSIFVKTKLMKAAETKG